MTTLIDLEKQASSRDLLLRLQVRRPLNLWTLRLVVAQPINDDRVKLLGELKAWAYAGKNGLQLDTMQVHPEAFPGVGHLIWAATMAWAMEATPCREARLLAIRDEDHRHSLLVRYFKQRGFHSVREVGGSPLDLPLRIVWGGAGVLMKGNCKEVFENSCRLWEASFRFV